jgi:hypothetical protein
MNRKKSFIIVLQLLFIIFACSVFAARPMPERMKARLMIKRTAGVILIAYKQVKENKVYTGDLAKAISHQKFAKILFLKGEYIRAMHQTRRARVLAFKAIAANKGTVQKDSGLSEEEKKQLGSSGPTDQDVTAELNKALPNEPVKDEDVLGTLPDLDLT